MSKANPRVRAPAPPRLACAALAAALGSLPAQTLLQQQLGTLTGGKLGSVIRGTGDLDGDGYPDFFVTQPLNGTGGSKLGRVIAVSGATRQALYTLSSGTGFGFRVMPIGDVDGDGRRDFAVTNYTGVFDSIQIRSGANGALIRTHGTQGNPTGYAACDVGDADRDGKADYAIVIPIVNPYYVAVYSGATGNQINVLLSWSTTNTIRELWPVGDLNNDGKTEIAVVMPGSPIAIVDPFGGGLVRTVTGTSVNSNFANGSAVADLNGDGKQEILVTHQDYTPPGSGAQGCVQVLSAATGAVVRNLIVPNRAEWKGAWIREEVANAGDVDQDLVPDVAVKCSGVGYDTVQIFSGRTGALIATWYGTVQVPLYSAVLSSIGDLNGDGCAELLVGVPQLFNSEVGAWQVVSGRVLAGVTLNPVACGAGPFPTQLGVSRPVLGQAMTVVGRDCPPLAQGTLLMARPSDREVSLGAYGCNAWLDLASVSVLHAPPPGSTWSLPLPLPLIPQLAGFELALQAVYGPTLGPLGFDLSNGVTARLGF